MTQYGAQTRLDRRHFLAAAGTALLAGRSARAIDRELAKLYAEYEIPLRHEGKRPRIAGIYTELREFSHAYHILESHMGPYLFNGKLTDPGVDVVSWYADQFPEGDMTREAARRLGMPLFDSIEKALTLGGDELAVDGVLLIGEHGDYPKTPLGAVMYPRKEFFDQIVAVMDRSQRYVPVFNDKHLSYRWDWARQMYDTVRAKGIPFMAGSSVPLAHRIPDVAVPQEAPIVEAVSIHGGPLESYDFHGLEVLESNIELRRGGEQGIRSVQVLAGDELLAAAQRGEWSLELAEAAMRAEFDDAFTGFDTSDQTTLRHGLLLEHVDGLRTAVLAVGSSGVRWNFACRLADRPEPIAFRYNPGPWGNRNLFRALSHAIQELFIQGQSPYPVERTLLATGVLETAMMSHNQGGVKLDTPHLEFAYSAQDDTAMRERGASWEVLTQESPQPPRFEPGDIPTIERIKALQE
jgi:hypothetical protein